MLSFVGWEAVAPLTGRLRVFLAWIALAGLVLIGMSALRLADTAVIAVAAALVAPGTAPGKGQQLVVVSWLLQRTRAWFAR
jgi:hypothetical protein